MDTAKGALAWIDSVVGQPLGLPAGVASTVVLGLLILLAVNLASSLLDSGAQISGQILRKKGTSIVLLGNTNSGKTTIFYQLLHGKGPETVTSMMTSSDKRVLFKERDMSPAPKPVSLVDYPGHQRLRGGLTNVLKDAGGVIFTLDSSNPALRDTAELVYDMFTDQAFAVAQPPVLFACNKADAAGATSPEKLRAALEQELDKIKDTRAALASQGDEHELMLGTAGQSFTFDGDAPVEVDFVACSAGEGELEPLEGFIREVVPQ